MSTREKIEAALAQARADREKAAADRVTAGATWRKQDDASVTYDKVRSNWVQADAEWNRANSEVEKLSAALVELVRTETVAHKRTELEAAVAKTRAERDKADAALAAVARARAERESIAAAPAPVERRGSANDRRKSGSDRRMDRGDRRNLQAKPDKIEDAVGQWTGAVANYNRAEAEWNRARAALAEFIKLNSKKLKLPDPR